MKHMYCIALSALIALLLLMLPVQAEEAQAVLSGDGFEVLDLDGSGSITAGDTVLFGSYPQSRVGEDALAGSLASLLQEDAWTAYADCADSEAAELMLWQDVTMDGGKYRAVRIEALRPWYADLGAEAETSNVDDNGFAAGGTYYFRYEPIHWTVLSFAEDGTALLHALTALDSQPYQLTYEGTKNAVIPGTEVFTNNWEHSSIRAFLNGTFFNTAFSAVEQELVQTVTLDNVNSTEKPDHKYARSQNATQDRVYLLSYQDLINPDYGFSTKANYSKNTQGDKINDLEDSTVREAMHKRRTYSDYSTVMGVRTSRQALTEEGAPALAWMLRSPGATSTAIYMVNKYGSLQTQKTATVNSSLVDCLSYNTTNAVVPAVTVLLKEKAGEWTEGEWTYSDADGTEKVLSYYLYVPSAQAKGEPLPMVTWIADASMLGKTSATLLKQKAPILWTKEEKMTARPCFFLTFGFREAGEGYDENGAMGQIVPIVDAVAAQYGMDTDRLYLTGQSFGGIADFMLNTLYPDKWAATCYVACQPGGSGQIEGDEQAEAVMAAKAFENQKFVYIVSQLDAKAWPGQNWIRDALEEDGVSYAELDGLKYKSKTLESEVEELLSQGYARNFLSYSQLTKNGAPDSEHMDTWRYAYSIDAVWNWLLDQSR